MRKKGIDEGGVFEALLTDLKLSIAFCMSVLLSNCKNMVFK